ncbi:MAG TPA: hypothetical protein VNO14_18725 [Blastocatellia bacterium]|nr:hypothetical protein [Blastocatellia bacterium]
MDEPETGSAKGSAKKAGATRRAASKSGAAKKGSAASTARKTSTKKAPAARTAAKKKAAQAAVEPPPPPPESTLENVKLPATRGKAVIFGGPKDRGIKPDDKLSLPTGPHFVYERVRSLNPKSFYCAMRFDVHIEHKSPEESKRWWANKKILVTNPANGNAVVVRAVDIGPHESTGYDIGLSPGAAQALGIEPGAEVEMVFADQKAQFGPVSK